MVHVFFCKQPILHNIEEAKKVYILYGKYYFFMVNIYFLKYYIISLYGKKVYMVNIIFYLKL